jgi:hypothetical protein
LKKVHNAYMRKKRSQPLTDVLIHYGSITLLAKRLQLSPASVSAWERIPMRYLADISGETGIPRQKLRPDLYDEGTVS